MYNNVGSDSTRSYCRVFFNDSRGERDDWAYFLSESLETSLVEIRSIDIVERRIINPNIMINLRSSQYSNLVNRQLRKQGDARKVIIPVKSLPAARADLGIYLIQLRCLILDKLRRSDELESCPDSNQASKGKWGYFWSFLPRSTIWLAGYTVREVKKGPPRELRRNWEDWRSTFLDWTRSAIVLSRGTGPLPLRFLGARSFFVETVVNDPPGGDDMRRRTTI